MSKEDDIKIVLTRYHTFFGIAMKNYSEMMKIIKDRDSRIVKNDVDVDYNCEKNAIIERHSMIVVVFCAMTLESFINNYISDKYTKTFIDNHLDRMNIRSKWIIFPLLVNKKQIKIESKAYELFNELITLRDRLLHDKTKTKKVCEINEIADYVTEYHAIRAITAVREMLKEISKINPMIDISWLDSAEDNLFA